MDLWLFVRRISLSATAIALTLILCATVLYLGEAWPGLTFLDCLVRALYMMTMEGVDPPRTWYL